MSREEYIIYILRIKEK
ncbi:uncharacterized protein FRV6_02653 [Fusarium oxysporum]|uniref:Uncharacterized protein n=1 Tax=Fusarium oxysporum TaxID=5507 RepID=A0A2H3T655_FUSOX|nr:uncharacterized protein FRV6_02653 [Fusarium oxysporum]